MINKTCDRKLGFTLIELILYIGIVSIFISAVILFSWDIIYGRVKAESQRKVNQSIRLVSKRITYELRNASGINSLTPSSISLISTDPGRNPTVISLAGSEIIIGWGPAGNCPSISPCSLTGNGVLVSGLTFTNLSTPDSINIGFDLVLESSSQKKEFQYERTYSSAVELRSN